MAKSVACKGTVANVADAFSALEELAGECREVVDNAPNGLSETQRIQTLGETADTLEGINAPDEGDLPPGASDLPIEYSEQQGKRLSRSDRRDNAVAILRTAIEVLEAREQELRDSLAEDDPDDKPDPDDEREKHADDIRSYVDELDNAASEAEGVEFPGMFG